MKSYLSLALASVLSVSGLTAASAADLPMKAPPPAPVIVSNFTGCYIDGGGGYNVWNNDHSLTGPVGTTTVNTVSTTDGGRGYYGRVGAGCDYQLTGSFSNWVIGIMGDYDFMDAPGNFNPMEIFPAAGAGISPLTFRLKQTDAYYVGGRVGYIALPNLLTYVDGGWTGTRFSAGPETQTATGAVIAFSYPSFTNHNGWFVGGGTEYLLPWFKGLYWRNEYRYAEYGFKNIAEFSTTTGALTGNVQHVRTVDQTVTTSLVWKFNWAQPVVARY
jgi:outer membrane immunogenic protein